MKFYDRDTSKAVMRHYATVERKRDRVKGLEALLEAWEAAGTASVTYLRDLRRKLASARTQLKSMGEEDIPEES
jgi:hypothetical protein